jgi:hypothetical protein
MRLVYSLTLVIQIKSQSSLYLDAYSWKSFISASIFVSNLFTIIKWPTLATMPLRRTMTTTMPIVSTTNTGASVDHASLDAANYATDYGQHAASTRTTTSTMTSATRQDWGIPAD